MSTTTPDLPFSVLTKLQQLGVNSNYTLSQAIKENKQKALSIFLEIEDEVLITKLVSKLALEESARFLNLLCGKYRQAHSITYLIWIKVVLHNTPFCGTHLSFSKKMKNKFNGSDMFRKNYASLMMIKGKLEVLRNIIVVQSQLQPNTDGADNVVGNNDVMEEYDGEAENKDIEVNDNEVKEDNGVNDDNEDSDDNGVNQEEINED